MTRQWDPTVPCVRPCLQVSFVAFITARDMPPLHRHEGEKFFLNSRGRKEALPSIRDPPTKRLSVVVPSYNEEKRCKPGCCW